MGGIHMANSKREQIIKAANERAEREKYSNFKVKEVYKSSGIFPYILEVEYDWFQPEYGIDFKGYECDWFCGFTNNEPCFEF